MYTVKNISDSKVNTPFCDFAPNEIKTFQQNFKNPADNAVYKFFIESPQFLVSGGVDEEKGPKGDQGDPGPKGDQGDPGAKGDQGDPGPSGAAVTIVNVSDVGNAVVDLTLGNVFNIGLDSAPRTINNSSGAAPTDGMEITLRLTQFGAGGGTAVWGLGGSEFYFPSGEPVLPASAGSTSLLKFQYLAIQGKFVLIAQALGVAA